MLSIFKMATVCNLGFLADGFQRAEMHHHIPNFGKTGQYFVDISYYISSIFKIRVVCHIAFSKFRPKCFCPVVSKRPICISKANLIKIGIKVSEILHFLVFMAAIMDFKNCEILLADHIWRAERHSHAKFRQNWSIHFRNIKIFFDF